ncbi:MAG TPA: diguanylate cyclase [Usitatibacter sp.]|nr:diguanylate cyclase [Usitatibacter sp.]
MAPTQPPAPPLPEPFASADEFMAAFARDSGGLVSYFDSRERVLFCTRRLASWFGSTPEDVWGRTLEQLHGTEAYAQFREFVGRALAGESVQYERHSKRAGGEPTWISVNLTPHRDASGRVVGVFSSALEVDELKRTHDALARALDEIATHIENTPLAVVEWGPDLRVKRWSPQAEAILGWTAAEALGRTAEELRLVHPDSAETVRSLYGELSGGRARRSRMLARNCTRDGRAIWCEWYNSAFFDAAGRPASILSLGEDVTSRVDAEEQLKRAAVNDSLTGLPNRNSLASRLEHAIGRVARSGERLALLFIDLDRFKLVNDTHGHAAGDDVLRQAGARIRACVRDVDTVARVGGDEFVVLLETDVQPDVPDIIGERLRSAFAVPFHWRGREVRCGASVGVSLYPDHASDPEALLASADEAMYRVKNTL